MDQFMINKNKFEIPPLKHVNETLIKNSPFIKLKENEILL